MFKNTWQNKIQLVLDFNLETEMLSGNSMGIYFEFVSQNNSITIHFKPLNEVFKPIVFNQNLGFLINFERDLIDEDDVEYALDVMSLFNSHPLLHLKTEQETVKINQIINLLKDEFYSETSSYVMLKTLLKVLLLHLIRFQNNEFLEQGFNQKRIFQFLELMESSFLKETNSDYYALQLGISVKRLNQVLKGKLGLTAKQIIQQRQITEAKRELIKREITTKELAFVLGFDSISSFSRFFKKNTGVSPSTFKEEH
jgi:AraC-like DNA-binding protein